MSKQRPNPDDMANELAGASAFFRQSAPPQPKVESPDQPATTPGPKATAASVRPRESLPESEKHPRTPRTPVRPDRRQMIRHAFELYLDQLDSLRDLADIQRGRGEPASMSRMVRDAIDRYLDDHPDRI